MPQRWEQDLYDSVHNGDEAAFRKVYDVYHQRVALAAWRVSHRADWVEDILNEAWCRAYARRREFDGRRPFLVWMAGIIRNVYREECRKSPLVLRQGGADLGPEVGRLEQTTPETVAEEAELLAGIHDCVDRLGPEDAEIVRLRFFEGLTLRQVAERLGLAESTLRDVRLTGVFSDLRKCLETKGIRCSEFFAAQVGGESQYKHEDQECPPP